MLVIDQDESALASARETLAVIWVAGDFRAFAISGKWRRLPRSTAFMECDGVLADIGISSMMVDDPSRGFSFMREGPLDMRMDRRQSLTAADVVNTYFGKRDRRHPVHLRRRASFPADCKVDRSLKAAAA